jgi:CBS domain-containing protein
MNVGEIMTKDVRCCLTGDNLAEAANSIWEVDCGVLPVVDEEGKLQGILTDRDLAIAVGTRNRKASEILVKEVMIRDVKTCGPEMDLEGVMRVMRRAKVRRVPVVDADGKVVGIITLNDLVMAATPKRGPVDYDEVVETLKVVSAPWRHNVPGASEAAAADAAVHLPSIPVAVA